MIIYATRLTVQRYKLKMPDEFDDPLMRVFTQRVCEYEKGDRLIEWGAKIFYFDHRKCIQVCNFASKFTLVLVDIKMRDLEHLGDMIADCLLDIFSNDRKTTQLLMRLFRESPVVCVSKLTDKSIISTLNYMQTYYLCDGYRLYEYLENNILHTKKINKYINEEFLMSKKEDGEERYFFPKEEFADLIRKRYEGR